MASDWLPPPLGILQAYHPLSRILHVKSESGCFTLSPVEHLMKADLALRHLGSRESILEPVTSEMHSMSPVCGQHNRPASSGLLRLRAVLERGEEGWGWKTGCHLIG